MDDLELALSIAVEAHRGQVDLQGQPYIFHPIRVMLKMISREERVVALLHDTVEDGRYFLDAVRAHFGHDIAGAVDALSRRKYQGESYSDYIIRVNQNELARTVKVGDLEDNLDPSRGPLPPSLEKRYNAALTVLK